MNKTKTSNSYVNFNLKNILIDTIKKMETNNPENRIKLNMDIELEEHYAGDLFAIVNTTGELISWLFRYLVNGVVKVEVLKYAASAGTTVLLAKFEAYGKINSDQPITVRDVNEHELKILIESLPLPVELRDSESLTLEFKAKLSDISESRNTGVRELEGMRILVAEDSEVNALVFSEFLYEWGCSVTLVRNGEQAVLEAEKNSHDLILMDIHMPVMNGNTATRQIRTFNPHIPIISLTASTLEEDIRNSISSGANDFLLKPISSPNLLRLLKKYT